ncbi:H3 K56 histone acetylation protein RTT109 [Sporodiniella umbellata]|nr:H3 K56 histone acetylation protein RTT109 [Sporodiniella umbellata]
MSFEQQFKKHVQHALEDTLFNVYDLCSPNVRSSYHLIKKSNTETFLRHRLILVSVADVGFVSGLEAYEYTLYKEDKVEQTIVYIAKVDAIQKAGVTGQLIQAYLASLPSCSVYVFARAQPQYLFAESAQPTKRILGDRELVCWWLYQLNKSSARSGWWFVPGIEDETSALIDVGARKRGWQPTLPWVYGTSYPPQVKAADVLPLFEDDAKSRFLKDHAQDEVSVSEFWDLLAFSEECVKTTGFFEIRLVHEGPLPLPKGDEKETSEGFTEFWNHLMSLNFSNKDTVLSSTQSAVQEIQRLFPQHSHFQTKVNAKTSTNPETDNKRPAVNTLSVGLIKRKKV